MHWMKVASASVTTLVRGGLGLSVGRSARGRRSRSSSTSSRPAPSVARCARRCRFSTSRPRSALARRGAHRFRDELVRDRGGKAQFPYLIDPNTGVRCTSRATIVEHLFAEYGVGVHSDRVAERRARDRGLGPVGRWGAGAAGSRSRGLPRAEGSHSSSTASRPRLSVVSCARRSASWSCPICCTTSPRAARAGRPSSRARARCRCPILVDPNSGIEMFESADIIGYLNETYARRDGAPESGQRSRSSNSVAIPRNVKKPSASAAKVTRMPEPSAGS